MNQIKQTIKNNNLYMIYKINKSNNPDKSYRRKYK